MKMLRPFFSAALWLCSAVTIRADVVFPADSGFVNVKERYGARGDGMTDDTAAFQKAAVEKAQNLYLPAGTYLVSDTLLFLPKRWVLQGQDREKTILRLKDGAPGFEDVAKPKPFVSFFAPFMEKKASTGQAFRNSLYNLTIEVGANNPGAVALNYLNNNQGTVEGVTIRSRDPQRRGKAGLGLVCNWPGPALIKNVRVEGFDFGVWSTIGQYSMAIEHLDLEGQREAGIWNGSQPLSIRGLRSKNTVPAIKNTNWGSLVVLIDSELTGGAAGVAAIENGDASKEGENGPGLFVRNLKTQGYKFAIASKTAEKTAEVPGPVVEEFVSHEVRALGTAPKKSLNLPIEETPTVPNDPPAQWVSVTKFPPREFEAVEKEKSVKKRDWSPAIQQAIDSGGTTVYFPKLEKEQYEMHDTVVVRGKVRRIIGMENGIVAGAGFAGTEKAVFRFADGASPVVVFERFNNTYGNKAKYFFEQATTRTLVLKNLGYSGYRNTKPGGKLFLDDVVGDQWDFDRQKVWARQLNPEAKGEGAESFNIRNRGGDLWILNLKTEGPKTAVETSAGGRTEVLGGYLYPSRGADKDAAAFEVKDGKLSASYTNQHGIFEPQVRVTSGGKAGHAGRADVPPRKYATKVPLITAE